MYKLYLFIFIIFYSVKSFTQIPLQHDSAYVVQDSVLIPVGNGINISATIVHKKDAAIVLPVVLFYTTYHQGATDAVFGKRAAERGYVGIVAYARGIRTNLKQYKPFEHEAADVYAVIDWISKQSWCNGSIGMYGGSYTGFAQWAAVKTIHPALKTIVPQVAVMPGYDFPMENNVPLSHILSWSNDQIYKNKPLPRDYPFDYFNSGVAYNKLDSLAGVKNPLFQSWLARPAYNSYWKALVPTAAEYARINIPILTTTGYYDGSQIGATRYFMLHNRYQKNAEHYFVIGPYDHYGAQRRPALQLMGYSIDSVANISMMNLAFDWLDYILKGKPKPQLLKDKVNYQVMGTNQWKHVPSFNDMNNDTLTFYLNKTTLTPQKPTVKQSRKQVVDFKNREEQNNYYTPLIVFDTLDASNGLIFTSAVFDKPFSLNGSFTGKLMATINKKDMDVSMALYEQLADGTYFFLTRYVGRASYAKNDAVRNLLVPGKKEVIPFSNTRFVSKQIAKGSKLVILLNVNKHPFEIINYGSGKPVAEETINDAGVPLQIMWHNDSFIQIPVRIER